MVSLDSCPALWCVVHVRPVGTGRNALWTNQSMGPEQIVGIAMRDEVGSTHAQAEVRGFASI
jgi:hypothetical protein